MAGTIDDATCFASIGQLACFACYRSYPIEDTYPLLSQIEKSRHQYFCCGRIELAGLAAGWLGGRNSVSTIDNTKAHQQSISS